MATIQDMGVPNVGSGILQPKLKYRWAATFTNLGGGTDSQPLSRQLTTVTRPNLSFEEVDLHRYNSRAWVASKHNWEPMSLTFEDDVSSDAARVIREQIQAQQYLTGVEGAWLASAPEASNYKFTTRLDMLDGGENVLERWTVQGCWIQNVDYQDLDYSSSDRVSISLSIRFDHAYQDFLSYDGPGSAIG